MSLGLVAFFLFSLLYLYFSFNFLFSLFKFIGVSSHTCFNLTFEVIKFNLVLIEIWRLQVSVLVGRGRLNLDFYCGRRHTMSLHIEKTD